MRNLQSRLAVLLAAIGPITALACQPEANSTPDEVAELCGPAESEHVVTGELGTQSEWIYGDSVVGFIDGRVGYVLN